MTSRITHSCALGIALALTVGAASQASAQTGSISSGVRIQKEGAGQGGMSGSSGGSTSGSGASGRTTSGTSGATSASPGVPPKGPAAASGYASPVPADQKAGSGTK